MYLNLNPRVVIDFAGIQAAESASRAAADAAAAAAAAAAKTPAAGAPGPKPPAASPPPAAANTEKHQLPNAQPQPVAETPSPAASPPAQPAPASPSPAPASPSPAAASPSPQAHSPSPVSEQPKPSETPESTTSQRPVADTSRSSSEAVKSTSKDRELTSQTTTSSRTSVSSNSNSKVSPTLAKTITPSGTATSAAANDGSTSSGMSNGAIAGVVIGVILALIVVGGLAGYYWKKYKERGYADRAAWSKLDDDIAPYPNEKPRSRPSPPPIAPEEYYASAGAPPANSGRLQPYYDQPRPDSTMDSNFAGYGAGAAAAATVGVNGARAYGNYPAQPPVAAYAIDAHGHPYPQGHDVYPHMPQHQQPMADPYNQPNPFDEEYAAAPVSSGPRQLTGPGAAYAAAPGPAPVPLGRPEAPNTYDDIAAAELYADDRYADDALAAPAPIGMQPYQDGDYTPRTAADDAEWAGEAAYGRQSPMSYSSPLPEPVVPLPDIRPMTPLMDTVHLSDDDQMMYADVAATIERMGTPTSPAAAGAVAASSPIAASSPLATSAPVNAPGPYQHGLPLPPLQEVPTPASSILPLAPDSPKPRPLPTPPAQAAAAVPQPPSANPPSMPSPVDNDDAYGGF